MNTNQKAGVRKNQYFLYDYKGGRKMNEREVTLEEYCRAERAACFTPKNIDPSHPDYFKTPATASWGVGDRGGFIKYAPVDTRDSVCDD
jgi:hypothetical protein